MTAPTNLTQRTYLALKKHVVTGRLMPGTSLNIRELAAQLKVSAGAVREALSRLSAERLVEAAPRGFVIPSISAEELEDLGKTRAEIEGTALRRAIEIGGDAWEVEIREAFDRLKATPVLIGDSMPHMNQAFLNAYEDFFHVLTAPNDRVWLRRVQDWLSAQANRARHLALAIPRHEDNTLNAIEEILEATLMRDADRAEMLLHQQFMRATHRIVDSLRLALSFPAPSALTQVRQRPSRQLQAKKRINGQKSTASDAR